MLESNESFAAIAGALRDAAATLRDAGIPFMLGGSMAIWARGGAVSRNDLDLMLRPEDAEAALAALAGAGMRPERPPEEWLFKVWHGDVMIDLIFRPAGLEITQEILRRADAISVLAIEMPVMAIEDVLATKLNALNEHALDYRPPLAAARSVREQIDWDRLRRLTHGSPFAAAFFTLVRELGIAPAAAAAGDLAALGSAESAESAARSGKVHVLNP
jgi:hypothetical protein